MIDPNRIIPTARALAEPAKMRWFGKAWNPAACDPDLETPIPVGVPCIECAQPIGAEADGLSLAFAGHDRAIYHLDCFLGALGLGPCARCGKTHGLAEEEGA